jgi:hypothetical protein
MSSSDGVLNLAERNGPSENPAMPLALPINSQESEKILLYNDDDDDDERSLASLAWVPSMSTTPCLYKRGSWYTLCVVIDVM